jgi:hypothetical protein
VDVNPIAGQTKRVEQPALRFPLCQVIDLSSLPCKGGEVNRRSTIMQDNIIQSEQDVLHRSGDLLHISRGQTEPQASDPPAHDELFRHDISSTMIIGITVGVLSALLTILIISLNTATFQAATQQIALDRLTVKTALALAGWELLTILLNLLLSLGIGWIIGRIADRRWLGFLAGAIAGTTFVLMTLLVGLLPDYPGNLGVISTQVSTRSLAILLLLLCLWGMGGGLVGLLGAWSATVELPSYTNDVTEKVH